MPRRRLSLHRPSLVIDLSLGGLIMVAWGVWLGAGAAVTIGVALFIAIIGDALVLLFVDPWRGVVVNRFVSPNPVVSGESVLVSLQTSVSSRWPVGRLSYQDSVGSGGTPILVDAAQDSYRIPMTRRGLTPIGPMSLLAGSPLGLWQSRTVLPGQITVTVWPATTPMHVPEVYQGGGEGTSKMGPPRPQLDDVTLREYNNGDDLHRVHWASLARTGKLLTRAEEPTTIYQVAAGLWAAHNVRAENLDLAASLLASWGQAMIHNTKAFSIELGALVLKQPSHLRLMNALATAGQDPTNDLSAPPSGNVNLLVAAAGPLSSAAMGLPVTASGGVVVVVANPAQQVAAPVGWQVVRVAPGDGLDKAADIMQQSLLARSPAGVSV